MSMIITQTDDRTFHVVIAEPELSFLQDACKGLRMPIPTLLGACFTEGIKHYYGIIVEMADRDKESPNAENTEPLNGDNTE